MFFKPSVDKAIAGVTKAVAELEKVQAAGYAELDTIDAKMEALAEQGRTVEAEMSRADRIVGKLKELVA